MHPGGRARRPVVTPDAGGRVDVDRPAVVLGSLPGRPRTADALGVARALGVRVEVRGPRGRLAVLDPNRPSRLAGLLTGEPTCA